MADGRYRDHGRWRTPRGWYYKPEPIKRVRAPVAPAREHSVMSIYVRGMGWVDIRPWRPR